tara:strand:+ start:12105 stop:13043 length:939 start_codon:yes stop_codon:yes gene_type:complete
MTDNNKTHLRASHDKQAEALGVILTITQSLALSGCNRAEKDAVVTHLMNGLQTGALGGDNFRSVIYHAPRLTQAIADGLNVKRRELKRMAFAGELTSDVVIKAIASQFNVINSEFKELPMSLGGDKPNKNGFIGTGILSGLCVAAVVTVFSLTNCKPANAGYEPLQGNVISLQGNDNAPKNNGNEINVNLPIAKYVDNGYYEVLLKNNSGRANRSYLAFYVTDSNMDSQIHTTQSDTAHERFKRQWGSTPFLFMVADGCAPTLYEGKTSLNKIAERRISGAVAIVAESDSSHPIFSYSVIPTQKTIGAIHNG